MTFRAKGCQNDHPRNLIKKTDLNEHCNVMEMGEVLKLICENKRTPGRLRSFIYSYMIPRMSPIRPGNQTVDTPLACLYLLRLFKYMDEKTTNATHGARTKAYNRTVKTFSDIDFSPEGINLSGYPDFLSDKHPELIKSLKTVD